jgi:PAS domain S-box-containing protein
VLEAGQTASILLVDDNRRNLLALEAALTDCEVQVVTATSGPEAVEKLQAGDYAVVLLDVQMAGMDGFETARRIRAGEQDRRTPILFLTAIDKDPAHVVKAYTLGAVDYIFKPVDSHILRAKVAVFVDLYRQRRQLESQTEQLATTTAFLQSILEAPTEHAIIALDADGSILAWNAGAQRNYDYTAEELVGRQHVSLLHAEGDPDLGGVQALLDSARCTGRAEGTLECIAKGGRRFIAWVAITLRRDATGAPIGYVLVANDITERRRVNEERAQLLVREQEARARLEESNRALEEATRTKSAFLATMSHELRTPLNSIIGFSDLLLEDEPGADAAGARRRRYLSHIHESGCHLLDLVNDILDLAKVEAGRMDLHPEPFDPTISLHAVEAVIRPLADKKQITLTTDVAAGLPTIYADEAKFRQVLYNLLSNAVKFTDEGGWVKTGARLVDGELEVVVADNGSGITPEDQARIFEEFQQGDSAAARRHEGTGLGLALARRLVELQGGRIWVESAPGEGSRFGFTMALRVAAPSDLEDTPAEARDEAAPDTRPLVLVAEDEAGARSLLHTYLEQGGYRVATVADGDRVVEQVRALRPVAVTLDVMLPGRDGWEVLQALKDDPTTADVPVVIVSVLDNQTLGYALGASAYLTKPIGRRELLPALARAVRASAPGAAQSPKALVVDDDAHVVELVTALLQPAGYTVLRAQDGAHAVALARLQRPDVVLLDLLLPGTSGFTVVEQLKADASTQDIPIVILTAEELTAGDRAALNGHIAALIARDGVTQEQFLAEVGRITRPVAPAGTGSGGP